MLESDRSGVHPTISSKRNERSDDLTRNPKKNKRINPTRSLTKTEIFFGGEETTGLLISDGLYADTKQGVWSELSEDVAPKLSKSVVSLALVDGEKVLFACSGIAVLCMKNVTRFLTSANLVRALNEKRKDHDNLKVHVRHGDNVETGFLGQYDLDQNVASVHAMNFSYLQTVVFCNSMEFPPRSVVVSVGMDIAGKLIGTNGILNDDISGPEYSGKLTLSKFSKVCDGGPLFGFDGKFAGMNLLLGMERTFFVPTCSALTWLVQCTFLGDIRLPSRLKSNQESRRYVYNKDQIGNLESLGYPALPKSKSNDGMILVNNFEDQFGDKYGEGVWSELSETVSSNIKENIVALASFRGEKRCFACTGFFIKWNESTIILTSASLIRDKRDRIVENLRIEVLRPNGQRAEGVLQHYNLHYNVALVSVKDFCSREPAIIKHRWCDSCELLAVGFCFESGILMASRGDQFVGPFTFNCQYLGYSSCRITKAGTGGPLLEFDGKFVGMNFYDELVGTPYLYWSEIQAVFDNFKTKRTVADGGYDGKASHVLDWTMDKDKSVCPNRWPVPVPFWCHPDDLAKHKSKLWRRRQHIIPL